MSKLGKYHWVTLFVLIFVLFLGTVRATKPRILVLYSYSKSNVENHYLRMGIEEALSINREPVLLKQHYMDLDSKFSPEQIEREVGESLDMIKHFAPDVIIIAGHSANTSMSPKLANINPATWIIPFSVEMEPETIGYKTNSRVVGIVRKFPFKGISDFMEEIVSHKALKMSIIGSDTPGNKFRMNDLTQNMPANIHVSSKHLSNCFNDWKNYVTNESNNADFLLILPTLSLREDCAIDSPILKNTQFIPWIEANSPSLPIGTDGSFVMSGGAVSFYPAYKEDGLIAMNVALDLINTTPKFTPKQINTVNYQVVLNENRLISRKIFLPSIYIQYGQINAQNYQDSGPRKFRQADKR